VYRRVARRRLPRNERWGLSPRQFAKIVRRPVRDLPHDFASQLENVDVVVLKRPAAAQLHAMRIGAGHSLLGLYVGTDLAHRGSGYTFALPDRIFIYQEPIERIARNEAALIELVRHTVLHELAHHFGISDARLREIGSY
jgi:predicted Zn-dependent protease with MMP-like domain